MSRRSKRLAEVQQEEEEETEREEEVDDSGDDEEDDENDVEEDEEEEDQSDENDVEDEEEEADYEDGGEKNRDDDDERDKEEDLGDDDGGHKARGKAKPKVQVNEPAAKKAFPKAKDKENAVPKIITGVVLSLEEMVQSSILYLLLLHHKKLPIKRADVVKHAINGQLKSFPEVMDKIKDIFEEKFGIHLVGVEESKGRITGYSSYILVSKYPMTATECASTRSQDVETKRAILYLILAIIFMLGRHIEEDLVWKIFVDLQLNTLVCKKRDDLRRFLKQEYVSSLYLNAEEVKETEQIFCRYSWGLRAEKEFSKYAMLKFVSKQFPEKKPYDFTVQYGIVIEQEKEIVEADRAEMDAMGNMDDDDLYDDAPAQTISFGSDGRVNTVEMRGGDPSALPSTLSGMTAASSLSMSQTEPEVVSNRADEITEAEETNEEPMYEDDRESGSESEGAAGSGSGNSRSGSDDAQEGSDDGSVSESSSSSASESDE